MSRSKLENKVKAVNQAHLYAKHLYERMTEIFKPLVGQKLEKVDGTFLEKIRKLLPELPNTPSLSVYRGGSNHSLYWNVRTTVWDNATDGQHQQHEVGVYVGNMHNGVLESMMEREDYRTDYTADEIEVKRETYKEAKKIADAAMSALHPFGENDW